MSDVIIAIVPAPGHEGLANMIRRHAWAYRYDNPASDVLGPLLLPTSEPPPVRIQPLVTVKWSTE